MGASMTPAEFVAKWRGVELKERSASQSHFNDLCRLLGVPDPITADRTGENFAFEKGASKTNGGEGWADVWKQGCFAWEYKGPKKDLAKAFAQLLNYSIALENPPLLIVSDMDRIRIHTNWTNTVQEIHEITLEDLADGAKRDLLRNCFTNPEALRPTLTRQIVTEKAAEGFAGLAQRLRDHGHEAHVVAHFINRLVFCMFAEDVGLLPNKMFTRMLEACTTDPASFEANAKTLFTAMKSGGMVGFEKVEWFNGGLFDDDVALPMGKEDIATVLKSAKLDWSEIDPSIMGTLFERGLDPSKRSQLGAHYTDREKIMMIIKPVIIEPLLAEWTQVRARIEAEMEKVAEAKARTPLRQQDARKTYIAARRAEEIAFQAAQRLRNQFLVRLKEYRILDPACGSGNFLYLALHALKDIEHRSNIEAEALGLDHATPAVGPENVLGIELNPYAAELARVSVWIGEIQWMRRNGFDASRNPILRALGTVECRDAVLAPDGSRAAWPTANVVVGNPPFLGASKHLRELGDDYTGKLRAAYQGMVPESADLVSYWLAQCTAHATSISSAGFVSSNSIRSSGSNVPLRAFSNVFEIFNAWGDLPWVIEGAAVRVSIICGSRDTGRVKTLDGRQVEHISSSLSEVDRVAVRFPSHKNIIFRGPPKIGPFDVDGPQARRWLVEPLNPNGEPNSRVLRPLWIANDVVKRPSDRWIIDFGNMPRDQAALFELPFGHTQEYVRPVRAVNRRPLRRDNWWLHGETIPALRREMRKHQRVLVTPMVSKHRVFAWMPTKVFPDQRLMVICRSDDTAFGILQSRFHEQWTWENCSWHGVGNDPVYNAGSVFETFPFPEGLTMAMPAADYAVDSRAQAIAAAAAKLNELRENWLNPSDLVRREPEIVAGYPDRLIPVSLAAAAQLAKRTLTTLYNQRPAWLDNAHKALDEAVAEAYGWGDDWRAGLLTDDEILRRLFELNQARAT